jgi:hypothetical protein
MIQRCHNPNNPKFPWYGGRGITVYPEWRDSPWPFIDWVNRNLGARPDGCTLDRLDPDGPYAPGNLRWADRATQLANRRPKSNKLYPGIKRTQHGYYEARIVIDGKRVYLGMSKNPWEAACLYADAKGIARPPRPEDITLAA